MAWCSVLPAHDPSTDCQRVEECVCTCMNDCLPRHVHMPTHADMHMRKRRLPVCLPRSGTLDRVHRGQGSQEAEMPTARDGEE